jgi:hypothetical protein
MEGARKQKLHGRREALILFELHGRSKRTEKW